MAFLDSSVLLASLGPEEAHHVVCDRLLSAGGHPMYAHALAESFSVLTGGRKARAEVYFTLNLRDFQALARPGDPFIRVPD